MDAFLKTFEFHEMVSEKDTMDAVFKSWDVGFLARKGMAAASKPLMRIKKSTQNENQFYVVSRSSRSGFTSFRTVLGPMTLDQESEVKRPDGKVFKATLTVLEPNKKIQQVMEADSAIPKMTVTREFISDDVMQLTEECDGNVCRRNFKVTEDVESKEDDAL